MTLLIVINILSSPSLTSAETYNLLFLLEFMKLLVPL